MVKELVQGMVAKIPLQPLARAVSGWASAKDRYGRQTLELMDRILRPQSNCIDVGCGRGWLLRQVLRRAPHGRHFAIEPIPERFARLKSKFPQVTMFNVAAGDKPGTATLGRSASASCWSCRSHESTAAQSGHRNHVLTARLDDMIPHDVAVRLVKVNVHGAEMLALGGALGLIRRCHPYIVVQLDSAALDAAACEPDPLYELLTTSGLAISLLEGWLMGHSPLGRDAFRKQLDRSEDFAFLAHP